MDHTDPAGDPLRSLAERPTMPRPAPRPNSWLPRCLEPRAPSWPRV
jgi:hypothetical protein